MSIRRISFFLLVAVTLLIATGILIKSNPDPNGEIIVGRNVNMVAGQTLPDGDPYLQRQNEPSMAVSTRNPLHLLAGANDYRTVDMPETEGPIPGQIASGDGWLGVFKSFNGGESWISTLLPGFPQDQSLEGLESPCKKYDTACDPTVRAGPNGLFYYSGIAFDRGKNGLGILFVARFMDNNFTTLNDPDPIKYLDATKIDEGTAGQFADKPWIAVDKPRYGNNPVLIDPPNADVQEVDGHNVYIVYSVFLGETPQGDHSKILFARSTDCGTTWEVPFKISEGQHRNQGTTMAVSPEDGTIYIAWRRFVSTSQLDAIMMCKSEDFGLTFNKAVEVATIHPFDQFLEFDQVSGKYIEKFRTYAFPTLAVDHNGHVYVAWADRGATQPYDGRIVIKTSADGINWPGFTTRIGNYEGCGHQFMPSLAYAAGKLMLTWYDSRKSLGNDPVLGCGYEISDMGPSGERHTIDVRIAQSLPYPNLSFFDNKQVSKYLHCVKTDEITGEILDPIVIEQREYNPPNYPLFVGGTVAFIGDYIDITPAPAFLFDPVEGSWHFNMGYTPNENPQEVPLDTFHVTWTDNRDVRPPSDDDWTTYTPPNVPTSTTPCVDGAKTGMRNQNIYTAAINKGIMVGAPVNTKQLPAQQLSNLQSNGEPYQQKVTFLVFVKNLAAIKKYFRLTIDYDPDDMEASFWEEWPLGEGECPFIDCGYDEVDLLIDPHSSVTLTVFVAHSTDPYATFRVNVKEIEEVGENWVVKPDGLQNYIILNPDPVNTQIVPIPPDGEYHTPNILIEPPSIVYLTDPNALSESLVYTPNLDYILNYVNPDIVAPAYRTPAYRTGNIVNPAYRTSLIGDFSEGEVTDIQWRITNNNDIASAYSFLPVGEIPVHPNPDEDVAYQLLIYKVNSTPVSHTDPDLTPLEQCELIEEEHHELVYSTPAYRTPAYRTPAYRTPAYRTPAYRTNTLSLAPGESAVCALRLISSTSNPFDAAEYATTVAVEAVPQAANPNGIIEFTTSLYIISDVLAGSVGEQYTFTFDAYGGTPAFYDDKGTPDPGDDILKYNNWTLIPPFPPGFDEESLSLLTGILTGTPEFDPNADYEYGQDYYFTVEVKDDGIPQEEVEEGDIPQQIARRKFKITIHCNASITAEAGEEGTIYPGGIGDGGDIFPAYNNESVICGLDQAFKIEVTDPCFYLSAVQVGDEILTEPTSTDTYEFTQDEANPNKYFFTFKKVHGIHYIKAIFARHPFIITATATQGGIISPSGEVTVYCGLGETFDIIPNDGYQVMYVLVDGTSVGAVPSYTFASVEKSYTIHAAFGWVRRYNNDSADGDDKPSDIAVGPSGNAYVTGYSSNGTDNDYATIKYLSSGTINGNWGTNGVLRYDGKNGNDGANDIAVDPLGNAYVTGYSSNGTDNDYATIKYLSNGTMNTNWGTNGVLKYDGGNGNDEASALALDSLGNVYVTGYSLSRNKGEDFYTISYDSEGVKGLSERYDGPAHKGDKGNAIAVDASRNVSITGESFRGMKDEHSDYCTIQYNSSGELVWDERYDARRNGHDIATAIALDSEGNVYITGRSEYSLSKRSDVLHYDYFTIKYNADNGRMAWYKRYDNTDVENAQDWAAALAVDLSGNVYVTGKSEGDGTGFDYVTIKYNPQGELDGTWGDGGVARFHGGNGADEAVALALDTLGNVYVTGKSQGNNTGLDYCTIKYDSITGNVIWSARYNNDAENGVDEAVAIAVFEDPSSGYVHVYVTGRSEGVETAFDYATVKYEQ